MSRTRIKNYILDTNVLLHDPHSVYRFADNHVWIPIDVLSELDKFKNEQTERGANARTVHRFLSRCFNQNSKLVMRGAKTPGGGTIRVAINEFLTAATMSNPVILPARERFMIRRLWRARLLAVTQRDLPQRRRCLLPYLPDPGRQARRARRH